MLRKGLPIAFGTLAIPSAIAGKQSGAVIWGIGSGEADHGGDSIPAAAEHLAVIIGNEIYAPAI